MALYDRSTPKHGLKKTFLKVALGTALVFGSYQFYTPDSWKDSVGEKVEHLTGSKTVGHAFGTLHPWEKPAVKIPVPQPGK
jgi:hypothetical protein